MNSLLSKKNAIILPSIRFSVYQGIVLKLKSAYRSLTLLVVLVLVLFSCSKKKAGFTHRLYHNTTSHYNWYFNALELMKVTEQQLWDNNEDNYLEILPIYILPSEEEQKNLYPTMDQIIEKCSTVIDRHSMDLKKKGDKRKKEHNKWIDENFLLIGIANYYKGRYSTAQEMFSYTAKKYKDQPTRFEAALWLARNYIEMERYAKAITVLSVIENDEGEDKPKDFDAKYATVYSDLYLRQERYKDAIPFLEDASVYTKDKQMKARLTYILGQVYNEQGRSQDAIDAFGRVVDLRPSYEMEFYAKISQALSYDRRLDSKQIKDMLWAMAKDEKNEEYYDQIYFALAEIEFEEQNVEKAIELYQTSARKSVSNPRQKGQSYLRLAEIFFDDREYVLAKNYYDSTSTYLPEDFPNYKAIEAKGKSLVSLVDNLDIVYRNDSLLALANLDEKEREKKILKMIATLEAEEERKKQAELDALQQLQVQNPATGKSSSGGGKNWYFYNPSTVGSGFQEFKRRWGQRKLEDNWRRSIKSSFIDNAQAAGDSPDSIALKVQQASSVKSLEEYLAELPLSDSSKTAAEQAIADALYQIGTIYKEKLKDDDNAVESFLRVTNDFEEYDKALPSYYQLYRIYFEKEQSGGFVGTGFKDNSEYYKSVILADYPDSEFAKLILNPDYASDKNERYEAEKAAYEATYKQYSRRQYSDVIIACNSVIQDEPNNNFIAKYYLVKALTIGARRQADSYENLLREIIAKFPGTQEADKAAELLGELNKAKSQLARNKAGDQQSGQTDVAEPKPDNADVNTSMFKEDDGSEHFFALVFPKTEGNSSDLKATISDFNSEYFRNDKLRITNSFIDKDHQIIIVRSFDSKAQAMDYYSTFMLNSDFLSEINEKDYEKFVITTKNFTVLFRNKNTDVYQVFFTNNYL